jgi:hypothetical protein
MTGTGDYRLSALPIKYMNISKYIFPATLGTKKYGYSDKDGYKEIKKLHGLSPRANYIDRATAACQRSDCHLLRIEGATWSA